MIMVILNVTIGIWYKPFCSSPSGDVVLSLIALVSLYDPFVIPSNSSPSGEVVFVSH